MKILIAGASGLVGTALCDFLKSKGHEVFTLVRDPKKIGDHAIFWNNENLDSFEKMDAVINLAGESIASGRWTKAKKEAILKSRVQSTTDLCRILSSLKYPPKVLINASAIGFYGDRGEELLTEQSVPGNSFLSTVCQEWEASTNILKDTPIRVVLLRFGAVLSANGGMMAKIVIPFKLGLGGMIGSGDQYFSFITLSDLTKIILFAIVNTGLSGPVNAVTPNPVTNREFTKTFGKVLQRPTICSLPAKLVSLIFGQMGEELFLASAKVYPTKLEAAGFKFDFPTIHSALTHILQ